MKLILDTDIGTDIDDALALAYLLQKPDCDLLGITTVTGEAGLRARLASALCRVAGRNVPIHPGVEHPLLVEQKQKRADQASALGPWAHDTEFPSIGAVEFIRQTILEHPGEVTLLTIGPLTNAGLLFVLYPEILPLLGAVVSMGGIFGDRPLPGYDPLEWNASGDPHATVISYRAAVSIHRTVGLDVTSRVTMGKEDFRKRCRHPLLKPVLDFSSVWFEKFDGVTFHDPLAAVCVFKPDVCRFLRGRVDIEISDPSAWGRTRFSLDPAGRHEVAFDVDTERFFKEFFSVFE